MKLYSENDNYKLYQGNMLDMLEVIEKESIDSIITDPPYELNFMNKGWDNSGIAFQPDTWKQCYEVLKPGGYLLAFGGSRTFHRIACAIEDAGFEIRDTIMWLYGSGFPKSMNIGLALDKKNGVESKIVGYQGTMMDFRDTGKKQKELSGVDKLSFGQIENSERKQNPIYEATNEWQGWGTALKPSFEPIIVARKPFKGSLVDNVIENGVGGINIDECRVDFVNDEDYKITANKNQHEKFGTKPMTNNNVYGDYSMIQPKNYSATGRFPANTILTYDETDFDEVCGGFPNTKSGIAVRHNSGGNTFGGNNKKPPMEDLGYADSGSASRYFMNCKYTGKDEEFRRYIYTPKASKKDRDEGLDEFEEKMTCVDEHYANEYKEDVNACSGKYNATQCPKKNNHPTVKPTELMQYLVRLVSPNGATILDPFNGSGSTGKAVMYENYERNKNYKYIGIELTEEYLPISKARIEYVCNLKPEINPQMSIFDFKGSEQE